MLTKNQVLKAINYMKWGHTNYVAMILGVATPALVVKGFFFPSISIWVILPIFFIPYAVGVFLIGKWDFKKGLYPSASAIGIKNSPPSRDLYRVMNTIFIGMIKDKKIPNTKENQDLIEKMRRWYE